MSPIRRLLVVALALVIGAIGCGVSAEDTPRNIAAEEVPFSLLDPLVSSSTTEPPSSDTRPFAFYLVRRIDDGAILAVAEREISINPPLTDVISRILQIEPTEDEQEEGLVTAIPEDTTLVTPPALNDVQRVLTIDLSANIRDITGEGLKQAFAQIVYTATELAGVDRVRFLVEGEPIEVLKGNSEVTTDPVSRADYPTFDPDRPPASTTTTTTTTLTTAPTGN